MKVYRSKKGGFTLVEILIVVVILGILAAIVIPQFTTASTDARNSNVSSQLQTIRSQIQFWKLQHGDTLPNLVTDWTPMTTVTTYNSTSYGPYLQTIPVNPLNNLSTVINGATLPAASGTATKTSAACGFEYDYNSGNGTGKIFATGSDSQTLLNY